MAERDGLRDRFLWACLGLGGLLRFLGIPGDLPYVFHFDEPTLVDNAVWLLRHETLNPLFFRYPTGAIYLLAALYALLLAGGLLFGRFESWEAAVRWLSSGTYPRPPEGGVLYFYPTLGVPALYLIGRCASALAGTAAIALVYLLARRSCLDRSGARVAALLLALSPLAVEHAHLITTDTLAATAATLALLWILRAEEGGLRIWAAAGALGGLAAGMKYNAGLVVLALPLLALWRSRALGPRVLGRLLVAAAAAAAAFLLTTPALLVEPRLFLRDLAAEFERVGSVTDSFREAERLRTTAADKIATILGRHLGIAALLAAAWGAVAAIRSRRFAGGAVLVWVGASVLPLFWWQRIYDRYLLLCWPALLLLAAWGIRDLAGRIGRPGALAVLTAVLLIQPGLRLVERESRRFEPDPRIAMTEWIERNVPAGERIVLEPDGPFPRSERYSLESVDFLGRAAPEEYRSRGVRFLAGSSRQRRVAGEEAFSSVRENLAALRREAETVWSSGRWAVYRLARPAWGDSARTALDAGDPRGAAEILDRAIASDPASVFAWKLLGEARALAGDTLGALRAYAEAEALAPDDAEPPLARSNLRLARGEHDEAIEELLRAKQSAPRDPLVDHNLAVAHLYRARERLREGDRDGALADWRASGERAAAAYVSSPGDPRMREILDQVERMGSRWGFGAAPDDPAAIR